MGGALVCGAAERTPRGLMGNVVALWLRWLSLAWQLFYFSPERWTKAGVTESLIFAKSWFVQELQLFISAT